MAAVVRDRGGPKVDALYNLMQSYENKLGGGEGIEGLYGSITQTSMQKVIDCMKYNTHLDSRSVFIDIGAGLGRPLLHSMVSAGVLNAWGVELDRVKCDKAAAFCENVMEHLFTQNILPTTVAVPTVICSPVEKLARPSDARVLVLEGVPPSGKQAFGELFALSRTLRAVAVVQRSMRGQDPATVMRDMGFGPLILIASFPVTMSGSGRSFTAYVFTKIAPPAALFLAAAAAAAPQAPTLRSPVQEQPQLYQSGRTRRMGTSTSSARSHASDEAAVRAPTPLLPSKLVNSPSKARKQADEAVPASPAKKPCGGGAGAVEAAGRSCVVTKPEKQAAGARAKAVQQVLLTSLPEYSRRTKQGAAGGGKAKGGKGAADVAPPTAGTRASRRLAEKVVAGASMVEGC